MNCSLDKYIKKHSDKKLYNLGKKYNNSLLALKKKKRFGMDRIEIAWTYTNKDGDIIGAIVRADPKKWKALKDNLYFCFPAPVGISFKENDLKDSIMEDIVNSCDPSLGIDMERDLDIAKLKLKLKLSQLGWEIDDVTG